VRSLAQPVLAIALGAAIGCAPPARPALTPLPAPARVAEPRCGSCATLPMSAAVAQAIEMRIADLKSRGGDCLAYGEVLESSLTTGRIIVRPYMWRVGPNLASAQAGPSGEMALAREIDSLNVGVRTLDDVVWSVEHEAAHIAFRIPSSQVADEALADLHVRQCRPASGSRASR
jgi:hypothetical protein